MQHVILLTRHYSLVCAIQLTGLTDMDQLNQDDGTDQQNANDEQESQRVVQPPRNRGLLRKLSSAFQRKLMTRYDSFDGHRDSLYVVHRQVKEDNIAYRPRVPYPDNSVDNEKSSNSNDGIAEVDKEEEKEEVRISDIASRQDARADIVSVPQRLLIREDEGHQKVSVDSCSNQTPLPPQLQND